MIYNQAEFDISCEWGLHGAVYPLRSLYLCGKKIHYCTGETPMLRLAGIFDVF